MANSAFFEQAEQNIKLLLSEKKYSQAHKLCRDLLLKYPDEHTFIKLKKKIEEEVGEENERILDEKFTEIDGLWKEEKYAEMLIGLKDLLRFAPDNKKVKKLFEKAQTAYKKKIEKLAAEFNKKQTERLNGIFNETPEKLEDELFLLERNNSNDKNVLKLTTLFRDKLIEKKIREKQDLIYSDKFDAIRHFIEQLKRIDKNNKRIPELEKIIREREKGVQQGKKTEFIYQGETQLDTLMKLKKYDKAIKAANEILEINKSNKKIANILKQAEKKFFKQTKELAIDAIYKNRENLKNQYQKDKSQFVKL